MIDLLGAASGRQPVAKSMKPTGCGDDSCCGRRRRLSPSLSVVFLSLVLAANKPLCQCLNQLPSSSSPLSLVGLEPAPSSIFGSLLGGSSNQQQQQKYGRQNSAGQQQQLESQQARQSAAELQHQSYKNGQTSDKVTLPGDILLGGLFPIHMKGAKVECGEINRDRGIQRLEAMLYALDRINGDSQLLPEIKLGAILLDSCSSSTYALNQSLEFIRASINTVESSAFECKDKSAPRPKYGSKMIAGVIGGSYSEVSLQVANLLRLFRIPQVSYASTGTALSDKTLYDLFARTVPSDMFQARAIADIVLKLKWTYVSLVSSEGLYGDSGSKEFMKQASNRNICIAVHEKVAPTTGDSAYDSIVASLLKRNATGVVLFTRAEDTRSLLLAVKRARLSPNPFVWVAADGWGTHQKLVEGVEEVAWGAITVELQAKAIPGFDHYMKALTPWQNARNPWFSEYWQEWFECQLEGNLLQQQQLASGYQTVGTAARRRETSASEPQNDQTYGQDYAIGGQRRRRQLTDSSTAAATATTTAATTTSTSSPSCCANATCARQEKRAPVVASSKSSSPPPTPSNRSPRQKRAAQASEQQQMGQLMMMNRMKQFCSPNLRISETNGYRQEQKVQFVVDAVYAMAHALHQAWFNLCDAQPGVVCEALKELNGGEFYSKYLLNVSFIDLAGSEVKFDERGDGLGRYNIYNFRRVRSQQQLGQQLGADPLAAAANGELVGDIGPSVAADEPESGAADGALASAPGSSDGPLEVEHIYTSNVEFEYLSIGRWTENEYNLQLEDIQFIQGDQLIPESYCSKPCEVGQAKLMRAGDHCCWICKTCAPYEYLPDENNCKDCGIGRWPQADKRSCFDLPQKYLRWDSVYSLISLSIACLGIALTIFVSVIFIKYLDTPVVKASGRELSFILLAGIAFCHLSTFVLLSKPTTFICGSQRFLVNFGFAVMYASLLVKTNRISRIFNCARKSAKRPSFISPKSQMLITGILVAIQIFLTIVWFVFEPPGVRADSPEGKRDEVILKCKAKGKSFIISLVYNMILITTCTVYAVKTRKIPENFNESKFIGFTMYTTIVIWLAFVTMFFGTNNSYEIQINTMCVCISLSAYVTLFCLFSPKLSIILLHPDKNVRKLTMNSATYKRPFKPVSSFASMDGGRHNTSGGPAYNGAQTDGASGPMSTTSNVLNLAESQAARGLQESSTISNVVNSNSAGSNGSQKTPTTLSQQLTLTGVCTNCGAHQALQASQPAAAAGPHHQNQHQPSHFHAAQGQVTTKHLQSHQRQQQHQQRQHLLAGAGMSGSDAQLSGAGGDNSRLLGHCSRLQPTDLARIMSSQQQQQQPHQKQHQQIRQAQTSGGRRAQRVPLATGQQCPAEAGGGGAVSSVQLSRSSILVSSAAGAAGSRQGDTQAKVVHCKIAATGGELVQQQAPVKRMSSDDHLLGQRQRSSNTNNGGGQMAPGLCWASAQLKQHTAGAKKAPNLSGHSNSGSGNGNGPKHMVSLSRLNEMATSTTSSDRGHCIDESISSLANDSLANTTSQDMTPCALVTGTNLAPQHEAGGTPLGQPCGPAGVRGGGKDRNLGGNDDQANYVLASSGCAKGGSDSMLWNQSVYSIDYCSDCCPSYCHCSCPACSSSLGGDEQIDSGAVCVHAATSGHQTADTELDEYDNMLCDSFQTHDQDSMDQQQPDSATQHAHLASKRRTCDEPLGAGGQKSSGANRLFQYQREDDDEDDSAEFDSSLVDTFAEGKTFRRSQTMEMKTMSVDKTFTSVPIQSKAALPHLSDEDSSKRPQVAPKPLAYALQAATNSALGAVCGVSSKPLLAGKESPATEQHKTSSKDKSSEKKTRAAARKSDAGQQAKKPELEHHHHRHHSQPATGSGATGPYPANVVGGAIRASIEMAKSTAVEQRNMEAKRQQRESGSSCFSGYHDDYELNYGLVQSDCEDSYRNDQRQASPEEPPKYRPGGKQRPSSVSKIVGSTTACQYQCYEDEEEEDADGDCDTDANNDEDIDGDDDDDDFEHDGRISLSRQASKTASGRRRKHHGGSSRTGSSKQKRAKELATDEHRINSVALIEATLSTGAAIVESSSMEQQPPQSVRTSGSRSATSSSQHHQKNKKSQAIANNPAASTTSTSSFEGNSSEGHISCLTTL